MLRFFLRSDDYVYETFLKSYIDGIEAKDMSEALAIGGYIINNRPRLVEQLFNLFHLKRYGKRFSYNPEESTL